MTHDHSGDNMEQTNTAEGNVSEAAPSASDVHAHPDDRHAGDAHDTRDAHGSLADHDGHDDHGGQHGDDSERSTLVPTTWRQLILPVLILILVAILVAGPLSGAFATRPAAPTTGQGNEGAATTPTAVATSAPGGIKNGDTKAQQPPTSPPNTATTAPPAVAENTQAPTLAAATAVVLSPASVATRTAVALLGADGKVSRAPVQLQFAGQQFAVDGTDSGIVPDWKPSSDATRATWIKGTYANHIIYLPYSDSNAALFTGAKEGDTVKLTMDNGQVFEFQITRSERALNGPSTADGRLTVTTAMNQDHAGVTIFLVGDPALDRAVVQADFTGNIQ